MYGRERESVGGQQSELWEGAAAKETRERGRWGHGIDGRWEMGWEKGRGVEMALLGLVVRVTRVVRISST